MTTEEKFKEWLREEMERRGWNHSETSLKAGLSKAVVSMVLRGERGVGKDLVNGLARAFNLDPSFVARKAGLLNYSIDEELAVLMKADLVFYDIVKAVQRLSKKEKEWLLKYIELRLECQAD